jgi:hypothetical protein
VVEKLAPVPDAGLPPVAVHANVYAVVPPEPVAVNVTAVPTVPVVGPLTVTARASGCTVTTTFAAAVAVLASTTVRLTVKEPLAA